MPPDDDDDEPGTRCEAERLNCFFTWDEEESREEALEREEERE